MKKYIGYIPAILFTAFYLFAYLSAAGLTMSMALVWLGCFWVSALLFHKGVFWGSIFGIFPAINMIYMGTMYGWQVLNIEIILFYFR